MREISKAEPRRRIPYWATLALWFVVACIGANLLTLTFQFGGFTAWKSLPKLSSKAVHIVEADGGNIWVEASNGDLFTLSLYCGEGENCRKWQLVENATEINPFQCYPLQRGSSCSELEGSFSPRNPTIGRVEECVGTNSCIPDPEFVSETYFALMSDGTVRYWEHGRGLLGASFFFVISTIVLPLSVVAIVSTVHLKGKQNAG